jgi:hypothetical protein
LYPDRDPTRRGFQLDPAEYPTFCFRFNLSDVTDSVSRSYRPVPVAGWREKRKNERERER